MQEQLESVLRDLGPSLSSAVAAELCRRFSLSEAAARQRIARREFPVRSLDLVFARGQSFLFIADDFQTERFFRALTTALESNNGAYARTLQAIGARGGVLPLKHLAAAAGLADVQSQLGVASVVARLVKADVLAEVDVPGQGACVSFRGSASFDEPIRQMKARLVAEELLLGALKQWAQNLALGSYQLFNVRGDERTPLVGRFEWDLTAPSYISGLTTWDSAASKPKPGFLVADILLGRSAVDLRALRPFLYKCETLRRTGKSRCLQIFLAEGFTNEALREVRKYGVIPGRIDELFGRDVAKALKILLTTLTEVAGQAVDPEKFDLLFSSLGRFEGASGRLRGSLFEFVAAMLLTEDGWHNVVMNKIYREGGKDLAEVDMRAQKGDTTLFVECKGIAPGTQLDDGEVEHWLDKSIPTVATRTRQNEEFSNSRLKFELWTTGELSAAAKKMVADRKALVRPTKYTLDVLYGPDLEKMAAKHKRRQPALLKVLQQHFLSSPLSEVKLIPSTARRDVASKKAALAFDDVTETL